MLYDPVIERPFQAIIVIKAYANTPHSTLRRRHLKFDLTSRHFFPCKDTLASAMIETFPLRCFLAMALSFATGPVCSASAAVGGSWPAPKDVSEPRSHCPQRSSFQGALKQPQWAADNQRTYWPNEKFSSCQSDRSEVFKPRCWKT